MTTAILGTAGPRVRQDVPRHAFGLPMRAHRVRPSEKSTPSRHLQALPRKTISVWPPPTRRGGLRTPAISASPQTKCHLLLATGLSPTHGDSDMHRIAHGLAMRARRPRPSEKISALPHKAISPWTPHPSEGRAPHARREMPSVLPKRHSRKATFSGTPTLGGTQSLSSARPVLAYV